ncbi:hypothetical protein NDU88_004731 [Pleurodeles waltl]|uniref:Uncharacterized protein n=1 Tax=Pleurodeles waltl TaxID=8319 RepID=A0AAV7RK13_PLEWA|nr:hypothetical protein NDU88_004731 [Pleurodeles waltl]
MVLWPAGKPSMRGIIKGYVRWREALQSQHINVLENRIADLECLVLRSDDDIRARGRGRATKQDGRLERELRAEAVPEGRRGREDSRTTHRVRCPSTPTTAATRNHVRGPRRSGTQGRKLATRPRPIRPGKRGGVASSEDRGRRARSGKEQAEQAAGTAGAVTTRIHLPTTPTNTRGPSPPHRETGRRSKGVRPLRQPGEKPKER